MSSNVSPEAYLTNVIRRSPKYTWSKCPRFENIQINQQIGPGFYDPPKKVPTSGSSAVFKSKVPKLIGLSSKDLMSSNNFTNKDINSMIEL